MNEITYCTPINHFQYFMPTKIIFGCNKRRQIGTIAKSYGNRVFLVTGKKSMENSGMLDEICNSLEQNNIEFEVFNKVEPNPTVTQVDDATQIAKKENVDLLIGFGGGSAIDVAKAIAITMSNRGSIWDYVNTKERPAKIIDQPVLPIIAIPSTSGTGSEATPFVVVTNEDSKMKKGVQSPLIYPKVSIIDPEISSKMPKTLTAITGMDAFAQALESYISYRANLVTDMLAFEALYHISNYLIKAYNNGLDIEARSHVALGASLAGMAIGQIDVGLAHAMGQPLSTYYKLPHGVTVALLTPETMRFNLKAASEKYLRIAGIMAPLFNIEHQKPESVIEAITKMIAELKLPSSLSQVGVLEKDIPALAEDAMQIGSIKSNIIPVSVEDVISIYKRAFK